ncbi:amidohydrolase [Ramlibacter sp.]|uniref:amidohydrolase n=1 Tax=Ramlibacter sp. TaxID=1917967 RepID=UPI003D1206B5
MSFNANLGADAIVLGKILTLDAADRRVEALAIRDGRVLAAGSAAEIAAYRCASTVVHDFRGRTVVPGFNDTHAHLDSVGLQRVRPSLARCRTIADVLAAIADLARERSAAEWIVTMPLGTPPFYFDSATCLAEGRLPTRQELDAAAPDNPVCISAPSGYWDKPPCYTVLNSAALALNGIDRNTVPRARNVEVERDTEGEPTGVIIDRNYAEAALLDLLPAVPRFTEDDRINAIRAALPLYHANGTTSIYEGHGCAPLLIAQYRKLRQLEELTMRVGLVVNPVIHSVDEAERLYRDWLPYAQGAGIGDANLKVTGIQVPLGGDPVIGQIAKHHPSDVSWSGYVKQSFSPEEFGQLAMLAARHDLRLHTIAADQVEQILAHLERVATRFPLAGRRWVIEHIGACSPQAVSRIAALGLGVTLIPGFHVWKVSDRYTMLDPAAQDYVAPAAQLLAAGVPVSSGTDAVPCNPLFAVWAMVTRTAREGGTLGKGGCLDALQALRLATVAGAWLTFDEHQKGPLQPGYLADLAVLSDDPTTVEPDRIREIVCHATMVGGRMVYREG